MQLTCHWQGVNFGFLCIIHNTQTGVYYVHLEAGIPVHNDCILLSMLAGNFFSNNKKHYKLLRTLQSYKKKILWSHPC